MVLLVLSKRARSEDNRFSQLLFWICAPHGYLTSTSDIRPVLFGDRKKAQRPSESSAITCFTIVSKFQKRLPCLVWRESAKPPFHSFYAQGCPSRSTGKVSLGSRLVPAVWGLFQGFEQGQVICQQRFPSS